MPDVLRVQLNERCRHTHDDHQGVGDAQIHDEAVGRTAHVRMSPDDCDDEQVAGDSENEQQRVDERDCHEYVDGRLGNGRDSRDDVGVGHGLVHDDAVGCRTQHVGDDTE